MAQQQFNYSFDTQSAMWKGENIYLRQVELGDLTILLEWENNPDNWSISGTTEPFTEEEIIDFIVEQTEPFKSGQIRFVIALIKTDEPIGLIDLFKIDKQNKTAGVGILINNETYRNKGYATEALVLLKQISKNKVHLETLHCSIQSDNYSSIQLFLKCNFKKQSTFKNMEDYSCDLKYS